MTFKVSDLEETKASLGELDDWQPSDFLLRGSYCPRPVISARLEEARLDLGANAALLLAADEDAMLRSLCFQAPKRPGSPTDIVGLLRSSNDLNSNFDFCEAIMPEGPAGETSFPASAERLLAALAALAEERGANAIADWLKQSGWVGGRTPERFRGARISPALLFLHPAEDFVVEVGGRRLARADDHLVGLAERLNATAQADVRRDAAIMARLDNELDPADFAESTVNMEQAADSLTGLALDVSRSDVGACYVFEHGEKAMRLVASAGLNEGAGDGCSYPESIGLDSSSVALECYRSRRAIQYPPRLPGAQVEFSCQSRTESDSGSIELVTPIVGPLASPRGPAVGVLTVSRLDGQAAKYGAYDLAVLRNISLRLALIHATANSESAARTFATLSTRATDKIREETTISGPYSTPRLAPRDATQTPLPDDLMMTASTIQGGIETLGRITGSHSATFRAALPSEAVEGAHGLTLRRVAAYPARLMDGDGDLHDEAEGGVNWRVALSGEPQYVPLVAEEEAYLNRREETLSELCVPVFVEGRVIGVVNLESASRNGYDAQVTTAQAFAAHVGLAIADARIAIASVLHDYATAIARRGHELGGEECRSLRKLADRERWRPQLRRRLRQIADEIEVKAKGLRRFSRDDRETTTTPMTFPGLVEEQREAIELEFAEVHTQPDRAWATYPEGPASIVSLALKDILLNVKRHAAKDGRIARLEIRQGDWGGREHDFLAIFNYTDSTMSPMAAANAYRALLAAETPSAGARTLGEGIRVPQLGAYLAGSMARRIGGDVHLHQAPDGCTRVTLSIPSRPSEGKWRGGT